MERELGLELESHSPPDFAAAYRLHCMISLTFYSVLLSLEWLEIYSG